MTSLLLLFIELMGHLPAGFSRIAAYFIQNGGEIIVCEVTGKRVHSKGPRGGLAIPCKLRWTSSNKKHVRRLDKLIATEKSKILQRYGLVQVQTCMMLTCLMLQ